ncbi:unnamed protein product [Candida verbasci]|uniref:Opaque-phase-specific protein OP4 n=1 Tax=Candida verbasci TaxID=1227364 RepID=A0A9W4TZ15_9ASCO|nr:unnamed protein product [Candida verbasci]
MKLNIATATLILASISSIAAAPVLEDVKITELTVREVESMNNALAHLNHFNQKRELISSEELQIRENEIVTDILELVKNTNLAPSVIKYFIDDPTLSRIATDVIVTAIKDGWINLSTLLKSLNDSGLAVSVIQDLINDCQFYAEIFKLVEQAIVNLPQEIGNLLGLNSQVVSQKVTAATTNAKRELMVESEPVQILSRDDSSTLTSLMESLKNSGLANQVVEALVIDDQFYTWGADLIKQLFEKNAISLSSLLEALIDSGLVPSIIEAFLNFDTLKSVIVNALAAAFGNCKDTKPTTTLKSTTAGSATPTVPIPTGTTAPSVSGSTPTSSDSVPSSTSTGKNCKRKRRNY